MTLLHNMSVPPRTAALLGGRPVASGVAVYSLPFALIWTKLVPGGPYGHKLGRLILYDPAELADAQWFPLDALPHMPPSLSIARALIDATVKRMRHG